MTLPFERTNALLNARRFLRDLLDAKATPRVPKEIRQEAKWILKHYPSEYDLEKAAKKCPEVFGPAKEKP